MEKDGHALVDVMRAHVDRLVVERKEFGAFDERLHAVHRSVQDAEQRMEGLAARERQFASLPQRVDEFSGTIQTLMSQVGEWVNWGGRRPGRSSKPSTRSSRTRAREHGNVSRLARR